MNLKDKIIERFVGGYIEDRVQAGIKDIQSKRAAVIRRQEDNRRIRRTNAYRELIEKVGGAGWPVLGYRDEDADFRSLSDMQQKELLPFTHEKMLRIAYFLYDTNGMAKWIVDDTRDHVVGEGITYESEDTNVQDWIDIFWGDSINNMDIQLPNMIRDLGLYGEQFYPVDVNPQNGFTTLGYIDPLNVQDIIQDRNNPKIVQAIKLKGRGGRPEKTLSIVREDRNPRSQTYGKLVGECFFFAVNKVTNAKRGRSDIFTLIDWIQGYEEFLYNRLDRSGLINNFVWDVLLKGMTEDEITEYAKKDPPPNPGSTYYHNENVERNAVTPDLKAQDASKDAKLFKNYILGCAGKPEHWFGEGGDVNRATAVEMGSPAYKHMTSRQRYMKYAIEYILKFSIDQAKIKKRLPENASNEIKINMPAICIKDTKKIADSLFTLSQGLGLAVTNEWISKDTAAQVFASMATQLGVEITVADEASKIAEERGVEAAADYLKDREA